MRNPGEIEDVKKKVHARARKVLQHGIGNFVWASGIGRREVGGRSRNSAGEKGEQKDKGESSGHEARRNLERYPLALLRSPCIPYGSINLFKVRSYKINPVVFCCLH